MPDERNIGAEMKAYLDGELRKLAVLPPSELELALGPTLLNHSLKWLKPCDLRSALGWSG